MYEKEIEFLLNYDFTEIEKVPSKISSIDETTKAILQELQKDEPLETAEPTVFEMKILETLEKNEPVLQQTLSSDEITEEVIEENPTGEKPVTEEPVTEESVTEESVTEEEPVTEELVTEEESVIEKTLSEEIVEEPVDYMELAYNEMVLANEIVSENQIAVLEQLEKIEAHGAYSNETDGMLGLYLMWIVPFFVIIYFFSKIVNPFTRI